MTGWDNIIAHEEIGAQGANLRLNFPCSSRMARSLLSISDIEEGTNAAKGTTLES